ncbi:ARM repeat-containing [Micractinium conductrix]|uniref:ARM repeat-containing n=1 Tax=Micractinium conductrix TaxID=554055 RepID=A0A2P6VHR4_9CHLO|nr:ARM repeat-containing [Micractinium conductrix]|eukprot:PSC73633.1 ARM repeat-containing [Micractinium conductrix]
MMAQADAPGASLADLLVLAGHRAHLERERALGHIEALLDAAAQSGDAAPLAVVCDGARSLVAAAEWEQRLGGLRLARAVLQREAQPAFAADMIATCQRLLEDSEVRVRWAVGELLRTLCEQLGIRVWEETRECILQSIQINFERDATEPSGQLPGADIGSEVEDSGPNSSADFLSSLLQQSYRVERPGTGEMRHGTEGWKCLETSFRALQHMMEGCGEAFRPHLDAPLRELIYRALGHPNRFIREACHFIMGSVCKLLEGAELEALAPEIAGKLGLGLSDNWSQVRFAASTATRTFMQCAAAYRERVFPLLLPHMCLNRYYVAEGVRLYSQETWRIVMGDKGREEVAKCAPQVVAYYIEQSKANNHAVREAACACIAELMCKVDKTAVAPFVPRLLRALVMCFKDASWPVRDAACLACGRCVTAFPEESQEVLEELYGLWFAHLQDNIYSVREDSAVALGNAVRAYGDEAVQRVVPVVREMIMQAKQQPEDSKAYGSLENTTLFGVAAQRARANDPTLHTDKTMFSCGSLAPKLQRGGGCVDHGFARDKEPWEASDGAVYMLRELAAVAPAAVPEFLPALAELSRLQHFAHAAHLHETVWKQLPAIAEGLGKKVFKPFLDEFLDPLFRSLTCGNRLCEAAAGRCIGSLRDLIGPGIFAGRLSEQQRHLLESSPDVPPPGGRFAAPVTPNLVLTGRP